MTVPSAAAAPATGLRSPQAGMLLVVLFWGANFSALKLAFTQLGPLALTALRFLLGTAVLAAIVWRQEGSLRVPRSAVRPLVILGVIGNTLYQLAFMGGLSLTSATNSALILASMPVVVTLLAGALGVETVSARQRNAVLLSSVGVVVVLAARGFGGLGAGDRTGDLLMMLAVLLWAAYTLLMRRYQMQGISSLKLTTWTLFTGTPGLVLAGVPQLLTTDWARVTWAGWGGVLYSALLSLVAAYLLYNRGVRALGASNAATYSCLTPLVAALIAMLALGERPTWIHLVGGAMIVGGVLLARKPTAAPVTKDDDELVPAEG